MPRKWYYRTGGRQFGPVPVAELKQMARNGQLDPTGYVRKEDETEWMSVSKVKGLLPTKDEMRALARQRASGERLQRKKRSAKDPTIVVKQHQEYDRTGGATVQHESIAATIGPERLAAWLRQKEWDDFFARDLVEAVLESRAGLAGGGLVVLAFLVRPWAPPSGGMLQVGFNAGPFSWLALAFGLAALWFSLAREFQETTWQSMRVGLFSGLLGMVLCLPYVLWACGQSWSGATARTDFLHTGTWFDYLTLGPTLALLGFAWSVLYHFGTMSLFALRASHSRG